MTIVTFNIALNQLNDRIVICNSLSQLKEIKKDTDALSRHFDGHQNEDELFESLALKDKIVDIESSYRQQAKASEPFVILHAPLVTEADHICNLFAFETEESWKRKLAEFPESAMSTPCFFARPSEIWKKIPSATRNKIDEEIYLMWKLKHPNRHTRDHEKGKHLREKKGFADPLINASIRQYYCKTILNSELNVEDGSSNGLTHTEAVQKLADTEIEKIAESLYCPIEADLALYWTKK